MTRNNSYRYFLYGILIFVVNLILKVWFIAANDISHDEPFTLFFAQGSPEEIIENLIPYNNPPLYELLLHYWIGFFGIEPLEARLFSCLISCFSAVLLFFFAKKLWNERTGWIAVVLFTFSTYQINFSHEARAYSLFFMLSLCSMYFFIRLCGNNSRKNIFGYVVFTVLVLHTHFFSCWIIFVQVLYLVVSKKIIRKEFLISAGIIIILFLPYFIILIRRFSESAGGTWLDPPTFDALYENIRHFSNQPIVAVMVLAVFLIGLYLFFSRQLTISHFSLLLIWFFVPYLLMFLISFKIPMFLGRYLIFLTPAFIFLWAAITDALLQYPSKWKWMILIPVLIFTVTVNPNPSNDQEPSKAADVILPYYQQGTMIVLSPVSLDLQISYHLDKELFAYSPQYRERERNKNVIPENDVTKLNLPDELVFVETTGGGYMDRGRKNYAYLVSQYEKVTELKYKGENIKAFSVFYFKTLKSQR